MYLVYAVVQLSLGHNNGPWVFPVPGNLIFFIDMLLSDK